MVAEPRILVARIARASLLVPEWDALCTSPFQRRDFLTHLEDTNACRQRYYELRDDSGALRAGAIVYTLPLDLLTYSHMPSRMTLNFLGVPCSQSAPGVVGAPESTRRLIERLPLEEPRFVVGLNLDHRLGLKGFVEGRNLPTVIIDRGFDSFDDYLGALRSDYRRRLSKIVKAFADVEVQRSSCSDFDDTMYTQYLDVYGRSDAKLEKLDKIFFDRLDARFVLTAYRRAGALLGWHITLVDGETCYFLLEGHDPEVEHGYFNLLVGVLREAIARGARRIDLGQTAEIPKMRLGGTLVEKHMFATHPSRVVQMMIARGSRFLEYRRQVPAVHVFKADPVR
ncbi:MAG: GNAT family N-acetyltransferase [Pseudomonadota bacterium]